MWQYSRNNELYHYGVKGMKWGVRRSVSKSIKTKIKSSFKDKHLGINENGRISLIKGKTSSKAKKNFAIRTALWIGNIGVTAYIATHPNTIITGENAVDKILGKIKNTPVFDL